MSIVIEGNVGAPRVINIRIHQGALIIDSMPFSPDWGAEYRRADIPHLPAELVADLREIERVAPDYIRILARGILTALHGADDGRA